MSGWRVSKACGYQIGVEGGYSGPMGFEDQGKEFGLHMISIVQAPK